MRAADFSHGVTDAKLSSNGIGAANNSLSRAIFVVQSGFSSSAVYGAAGAAAVDDDVGTVAVGMLSADFGDVLRFHTDGDVGAHFTSRFEAIAIAGRACNDDERTGLFCEPGAHQADGSGPADQDELTGRDVRVATQRLDAAGEGLDERGCIVAELGRYREDEPFRCCQILRESTVDSTADRLAILAKEVSARVAEPAAPAARIRGRVYGDAVANSDRLHARADFYHVTGDLVTERHRRLEAVAAVTYVQIRSADPGSSYGDLDGVVSGYLGFWYLAQLNPA